MAQWQGPTSTVFPLARPQSLNSLLYFVSVEFSSVLIFRCNGPEWGLRACLTLYHVTFVWHLLPCCLPVRSLKPASSPSLSLAGSSREDWLHIVHSTVHISPHIKDSLSWWTPRSMVSLFQMGYLWQNLALAMRLKRQGLWRIWD